MRGYAPVSTTDPPGVEWVALETALPHVSTVGNSQRDNSKVLRRLHAYVMEAEMAARTERAKHAKGLPELPLAAIVGIVSHRHAIWPLVSEFAKISARGRRAEKEPSRTIGRIRQEAVARRELTRIH